MPIEKSLFASIIPLLFLVIFAGCTASTTQYVFDPDDAIGTRGDVSGSDECGLDPQNCGRYADSIVGELGQPNQQFSTLRFGFDNGIACAFQAPPPTGNQLSVQTRVWNECPTVQVNQYYDLDVTGLPGPDYGLKRIRICRNGDGQLAGAEARFFSRPHLTANNPGQDVQTRTFERNDCTTWEEWSICPQGKAAGAVRLFSQTENNGVVQGLDLKCHTILVEN